MRDPGKTSAAALIPKRYGAPAARDSASAEHHLITSPPHHTHLITISSHHMRRELAYKQHRLML